MQWLQLCDCAISRHFRAIRTDAVAYNQCIKLIPEHPRRRDETRQCDLVNIRLYIDASRVVSYTVGGLEGSETRLVVSSRLLRGHSVVRSQRNRCLWELTLKWRESVNSYLI